MKILIKILIRIVSEMNIEKVKNYDFGCIKLLFKMLTFFFEYFTLLERSKKQL